MDPRYYQAYQELQGYHWWFRARAEILLRLIEAWHLAPAQGLILDIGCGPPGPLFHKLGQIYQLAGIDPAPQVAKMALLAGAHNVQQCRAEDYAGPKAHLALLLDVIEHVQDDLALLRAARRALIPGGHLLLTVPAWQFLWSGHDQLSHHRRRYRKHQVQQRLAEAGFLCQKVTYFNTWLFPLAALKKLTDRRRSGKGRYGYHDLPPRWLNGFFRRLFAAEAGWLVSHNFPLGVSILAVGKSDEGLNPD